MRLGTITQDLAEQRMHTEIGRIDLDLARDTHPRSLFRDCAARYLAQSHDMRGSGASADEREIKTKTAVFAAAASYHHHRPHGSH